MICGSHFTFSLISPETQKHHTKKQNFVLHSWLMQKYQNRYQECLVGLFSVCLSGSACAVLTNCFYRQRICSAVSSVSSHSGSPEFVARRERCLGDFHHGSQTGFTVKLYLRQKINMYKHVFSHILWFW